MKSTTVKTAFLAKVLTATTLTGLVGGAIAANAATAVTTTADSQNQQLFKKHRNGKGMNFEQRYQKMLTNAQAAANAPISAAQAVTLVQKQAANLRVLAVRYHDGSSFAMKNPTAQTMQPANPTSQIVGYRVMTLTADGKPQLYIVDAKTGQVTQKQMQQWAKQSTQQPARQPRMLPTTNISLAQAMQLAATNVGGKVIGASFGGHHGHHGKRGLKPRDATTTTAQTTQSTVTNQTTATKTPSYRIQVMKGQEIYLVKVNAQTGEISQAVAMKDMQNRFKNAQKPAQ